MKLFPNMSKLKILKAFHGDAMLLQTFDGNKKPFNILIDGGPSNTFKKKLKKELSSIRTIHLLILTHIDEDHIGGLLKFFKSDLFTKIEIIKYWFNGGNFAKIKQGNQVGYSEGVEFEKYLLELEGVKKWETEIVYSKSKIELAKGIEAYILSPTKEILTSLFKNWTELKNIQQYTSEQQVGFFSNKNHPRLNEQLEDIAKEKFKPSYIKNDIFNHSSIAFLLKTPTFSGLFLGDARVETIIKSLKGLGFNSTKKLKVDFVKISHHGSKKNTSNELLNILDCQKFIISTNGGKGRAQHPNRETLARIVCHSKRNYKLKTTIYFNYSKQVLEKHIGKFINEDEKTLYNFDTKFDTELIQLK